MRNAKVHTVCAFAKRKGASRMKKSIIAVAAALLATAVLAAAVQCKGTTQKGARCKNTTNNASGYCYLHDK